MSGDAGPIVIAACRRQVGGDPADIYPDPDAGPLSDAFAWLGAPVEIGAWDDPARDWGACRRVLVSSTWDSVDRPAEYLAWTEVVGRSRLVNPPEVLRWGIDKTHQVDLAARGVPVVPTTWVAPGQAWAVPAGEYVVKPAISAGGRATARYRGDGPEARQHVMRLHAAGQTVMVQPYMASVDRQGEVDLVFINGRFSHGMAKRLSLIAGQDPGERPWEQISYAGPAHPTGRQLEVAELVVSAVNAVGRATYARVDLIEGDDGRPLLLEVEVVDPVLGLDQHPDAARGLARAVLEG